MESVWSVSKLSTGSVGSRREYDWQELMIPWRIMRTSIAHDSELDPRCSTHVTTTRISNTIDLHPVASKILPISCPAEGRRPSWSEQ